MFQSAFLDALLGQYTISWAGSIAVNSGAVAGSVAANAPLYSMQWTDATNSLLIHNVQIAAKAEAFSSGVGFDAALVVARAFTTAPTGGTATVPAAAAQTFNSTLWPTNPFHTEGDIRIANTAAITAPSAPAWTLDTAAIEYTQINAPGVGYGGGATLYQWPGTGYHPLLINTNEGLVLTTPTGWAASNTFRIGVTVEFAVVKPK